MYVVFSKFGDYYYINGIYNNEEKMFKDFPELKDKNNHDYWHDNYDINERFEDEI